MLSFVTEFPVNHSCDLGAFSTAIEEWVLGSPHTRFTKESFEFPVTVGKWSVHVQDERIDSLKHISCNDQSMAVKYTKRDRGLEWVTVIVFSKNSSESWVGIRIACESVSPAARLPVAKKPIIVRTLLSRLGGQLMECWMLETSHFDFMMQTLVKPRVL